MKKWWNHPWKKTGLCVVGALACSGALAQSFLENLIFPSAEVRKATCDLGWQDGHLPLDQQFEVQDQINRYRYLLKNTGQNPAEAQDQVGPYPTYFESPLANVYRLCKNRALNMEALPSDVEVWKASVLSAVVVPVEKSYTSNLDLEKEVNSVLQLRNAAGQSMGVYRAVSVTEGQGFKSRCSETTSQCFLYGINLYAFALPGAKDFRVQMEKSTVLRVLITRGHGPEWFDLDQNSVPAGK